MRVLIDTNVLYSAFIQRSGRMSKLVFWICSNHDACITPTIANEILGKASSKAPSLLPAIALFLASEDLHFLGEELPGGFERVKIRDEHDQKILDAAIANNMDILISGDKDFHSLELQYPRVMFPAEFIKEFVPNLV